MPRSPFPVRVAAIDAGTNAIRFLAAEFHGPDERVDLEYLRLPVRLGREAFLTGVIRKEAMDAAVEAMGAFRRSLDRLGISAYRAVATSAVRESRNGGDLVRRARSEADIRIEPITGAEEARLTWLAARARIDMGSGLWMMADLGGGSLEISLASREGVRRVDSHPLGTVRLLEEFGREARSPAHLRDLVRERADALRAPPPVPGSGVPDGLVATGGNIETLADLAGCPPGGRGVSRLPVTDLRSWIERLASLTADERVERLGLDPDRADVILPASVLYERVARLAEVDEVLVPHVGVKEGLLHDLVDAPAGGASAP